VAPGAREALTGLAASLALLVTPAAAQGPGAIQGLGLAGYPADTRRPGFSAARVDGPPASLEGLEGHVVLVNFWATWCHECRAELPVLDRLHREYATRRLTVLSAKFREEP
jgi:thiol-disulfide isomerase/thioredoxin